MPAATPADIQSRAVELYMLGKTYDECAAFFGIGSAAVLNAVHRAGLRGRDSRFSARHATNHEVLRDWSADVAWLVGYICADGCVRPNQLSFACVASDQELLKSVKEITQTSHPIRIVRPSPSQKGRNNMARLSINSQRLVADLATIGVLPRKSFSDPDLPPVPDQYLGHFFRGLFDGDGCFHCRPNGCFQAVVNVAGSRRLLTSLVDRMAATHGLSSPPVSPHQNIFTVQWTGKTNITRLHTAMYPKGVRHFCSRKKDAFDAAVAAAPALHCRADSGTGFRGVRKAPKGQFEAYLRNNGTHIRIGSYATAEQAASAHNFAAQIALGSAGPNPAPAISDDAERQRIVARLRSRGIAQTDLL